MMMDAARRSTQGQRLTLCLGVALALHVPLLMSATSTARIGSGKPAAALQVRLVELQAPPTATEPPVADAPQVEPRQAEPVQREAAPAPVDTVASTAGTAHPDAAAPELNAPDAPLPGGIGQAKVQLAVEPDGYVRELRVEPDALPMAFQRAIERAFSGARVPAPARALRGGSLCVEVTFKEGESPSWQTVKPAGVCLA